MDTYRSTETVEAVKVGDIQGSTITANKPGKSRLVAGAKGTIDIGYTFVGQNEVKVGDYVLFKNGVPSGVMLAKDFELNYQAKK